MEKRSERRCPECDSRKPTESGLDRREFVKAAGTAALAAGTLAATGLPRTALAAPSMGSAAETTAQRLYTTLSDEQKQAICMPFDHEHRTRISANWHVSEPYIDSRFYSNEQRALINQIVRDVTSEEGYERMLKQMDEDAGGLGQFSCGFFGTPDSDQFQWILTGRHLTMRADGNSVQNMAFGGPIIYGHGEEDPSHNLYHYQTQQANEVFDALNPDQREAALLQRAPRENQVAIQGANGRFAGLRVSELTDDQKELFESVVRVMLNPYRQEDVQEVTEVLKATGGMDALHMAFYRQGDLNDDEVWDIWRVEGPGFVWHFRGAPHVHTYIHIGLPTT